MKKELTDITFCIPVRIESVYRQNNLNAVLSFFSKKLHTNFIILEADETRKWSCIEGLKELKYIFVEDHDPVFHRTKYINQMIKLAHTKYVAIWDTDVIVAIDQVLEAYDLLEKMELTLVYPYSGVFYDIDEYISTFFYHTLDIDILKNVDLYRTLMCGYYSVGGGYIVNREKYLVAGGENEYFYGWGSEDAERCARIEILEMGIERAKGPMFHLYHTRGINSDYANPAVFEVNKNQFLKVCSMHAEELKEYIATWNWIKEFVI